MKILCLGAGYTSTYLARMFSREVAVFFLSRNPESVRSEGLNLFDPEDIADYDIVLDTMPAVDNGAGSIREPAYRDVSEKILQSNLDAFYLHISSTSVYPGGGQIASPQDVLVFDENTPANPVEYRGEKRLRLEEIVQKNYPKNKILRSAGIYGPGRSLVERFMTGDFGRAGSGNRLVSRIHVHDLCRLIMAMVALKKEDALNLVNGVDLEPTENKVIFEWMEEELKLNIPGSWRDENPTGRKIKSLYGETLLGGRYRYPSFREGFRAIIAQKKLNN